jgi:hypothetical protein
MDVMASAKGRENYSGIFLKLKVAMAFLKYAKIAVASIKITLFVLENIFEINFTFEEKEQHIWIF